MRRHLDPDVGSVRRKLKGSAASIPSTVSATIAEPTGRRVLVIEDNLANIRVVEAVLAQRGASSSYPP